MPWAFVTLATLVTVLARLSPSMLATLSGAPRVLCPGSSLGIHGDLSQDAFAKSSETRFPNVSRRSAPSPGGKQPFKTLYLSEKLSPKMMFRLERSFLQNRLKRVSPKFHANRSHPRRVNGLSKFWNFPKNPPRKHFSARKIIFAKSSETRFPKVSRRSEPSSGGKRPFKILDFFEKLLLEIWLGRKVCDRPSN